MGRLIDAEALKKKATMRGVYLRPMVTAFRMCVSTKDVDESPTIDPVHAAGGCYCRECVAWNDKIPCGDGSGLCDHYEVIKLADGFCNAGRRREDADGLV